MIRIIFTFLVFTLTHDVSHFAFESEVAGFQSERKQEIEGNPAFSIQSTYPDWMDTAIIYQITPYAFVENGTFEDITAKLPELKNLGINTILLQPIYPTFYGEQGYDVTDYFSVNPALGTDKQLRQLIATAKSLQIKVLFDIVLNHTSIHHPYAQDLIKNGEASDYYNYYQHESDGKPYSSYYNIDEHGFVTYFWKDLVNLNYDNEEVQQWMLEACKYWVKEFDIDGYRFDAIWAVNARNPSFVKKLLANLKSIKPEILLLAEDKGSVPEVYDLGYDAAYDWTADTTWVSQWSWEYEYEERESHTIFNLPQVNERGKMLRQALFHNGGNEHRKLRYIENNDLPRFILTHGPERTKMAAALLFSLPGIQMLYNGQEIGARGHPYSTDSIFQRNKSIQSLDTAGLFPYYQKLIRLHKKYPALSDTAMTALAATPAASTVAFHRWKEDEHFIIVVNLDSARSEAQFDLRELAPENFYLTDVLTATEFKPRKQASFFKIPMPGYSVRWLQLSVKNN
jgi:cyclomaltodextrinase / maltogenic alpha-amylase / neopullulanase